ncbi:MAG: DUF1761 domain-containing protein [Polaromonas sp.]
MPDIPLNPLALLAATVAGFFLCYAWYNPLFGKAWAKEIGFVHNEPIPAPALIKSLLLTVVTVFLIALVLANNMAAWTPSTWGVSGADMPKAAQALQAAAFTWLGFFLPGLLRGVAWEKRSWKLFAIDAGYYLSLLLTVSFIIIYMR